MALPGDIRDRKHKAFIENSTDGGVDNRVNDIDGNASLVSILAQLVSGLNTTPSGLTIGGKITEVTLNSLTWTALPTTALTDRNGLAFQNPNGVEVKIGFDNTETGYVGWAVNASGEFFIDVSDSITVYAKASSGTPKLVIMEVA